MRFSLWVLGSAALLAACATKESASSAGGGDTGGTMVLAMAGDAVSLFPPSVIDLTGRFVQDQVFDRLAEIGQDLNTVGDNGFAPRLARKWTWAKDSMSVAFELDPRARWHDGKPVTASDVRFSFKAFADPKFESVVAPLITNIDSVHVQDSLTAVVWFKKHTPEAFYDVAYQVVIIPEHVYGGIPAQQMRTSPVARTPIGSGRFRFVRWDQAKRIELVADTGNYRGRAKLDRIIIAVPTDPRTSLTQVLTGQADYGENLPLDRVSELDSSKIARPMILPNFGFAYMSMNLFDPKAKTSPHPIFSDLRTRRALSMAVDRVAMLKNVFGGFGKLSHGPFPATVPFADTTLHPLPYDTTAAKAMLDSSGWRVGAGGMRAKNGRPLRFSVVVNPSPQRRQYAVLMQEQFRKLGVQMDIDQVDQPTMRARAAGHEFDALLYAWNYDPSPSGVRQVWSAEGWGADGQNIGRWANKQFDALLDSATASFDPAKTKAYSSRAFQVAMNDAPAIFLYDLMLVYGMNRRFTPAPMRTDEWWANLADWSVPAAKRIDRDRIGLTPATP
jgi:peptide/nickel transport system substrate-binding protein